MLREYFLALLYISVFVSIALSLAHSGFRRVTSMGAGVLLLCATLLPLVDILGDFSIDNSLSGVLDGIDCDATDSAIELAFEEAVAEYIADGYGVSSECVRVRADGFDIGSLSAERIYVTLSGEALLIDFNRLEEEVGSTFASGGECEVSVSLG